MSITKVYLLNTNLESDYKHTLYFTNASAQQSYFLSKVVASYLDFSYQRKDNTLRIPEQFDKVLGCNYVMYQNSAYNNKWFYAFITDIKYISDGVTHVEIEMDVIQTWLFDYTVKPSFIEREHVLNDDIGLHTLHENLECGEYICNNVNKKGELLYYGYLVGSTVDLSSNENKLPNVAGVSYDGLYNGLKYYYYASDDAINAVLVKAAEAGQIDAINSVFCVPSRLMQIENGTIKQSNQPTSTTWSNAGGNLENPDHAPTKPQTINGYTPKNKKLFTFPYCYLLVSNNAGGDVVYHYEKFKNND